MSSYKGAFNNNLLHIFETLCFMKVMMENGSYGNIREFRIGNTWFVFQFGACVAAAGT